MSRMRASRQIALMTYAVMLLIGLVTTVLAANARSDGDYWALSRSLGLRRDKLGSGLIPGLALIVIGGVGGYRSVAAQSSRRHRRK